LEFKLSEKVLGVIPARYDSKRFKGKLLKEVKGKPILQYVFENALGFKQIDELIIGTDDSKIYETAKGFNAQVVYTSKEHKSGTERVAEVASQLDYDIIINIQGDEPSLSPDMVDQLITCLKEDISVQVCTLAKRVKTVEELQDSNLVRIVVDKDNNALYFSRATIPFVREEENREDWLLFFPFLRHIGIYGFRKDALMNFKNLSESNLEKVEKLEQLRLLENGCKVKVIETKFDVPISIDTPDDLRRFENYLTK